MAKRASAVTPAMQAEVDALRRPGGKIGTGTPRPGASPRLEAHRARVAGWQRIESARVMQEEVYGYDFKAMRQNARRVCDYLTHMALAAFSELSEALYEFEWKRWTTERPWYDRDRILEELVDLDMFSDNMKAVLECTDEEYQRRYTAKQARNRARMAGGYASRADRGG